VHCLTAENISSLKSAASKYFKFEICRTSPQIFDFATRRIPQTIEPFVAARQVMEALYDTYIL
jgi:hypothetical protein